MDRRPDPRLLIVGRHERRSAATLLGLQALGWPAFLTSDIGLASHHVATGAIDAVIVEAAGSDDAGLASLLKAAAAPRVLPVLALSDAEICYGPAFGFDLVLASEHPVDQIAKRLALLARSATNQEQAQVCAPAPRLKVGTTHSPPEAPPLRILTVGEPSPRFLTLSHALGKLGLQTTAAMTAYTAFDYMHEQVFDAVVLWFGENHAEAASIAGGMRRNTRLHGVPTLLYVRPGGVIDAHQAFARGFADVLPAELAAGTAALRIRAFAVAARREVTTRGELDLAKAALVDPATGLFPADVFASHLTRVAATTHRRRRAMSVAVLRGGAQPRLDAMRAGGWLARASPQIDAMVARLVRGSDCASRFGAESLAIAFPGASPREAAIAAERVAAVIACTAFSAGDGATPFTTHFKIGVAAIDAETSPGAALDIAARIAAAKAAA